VNRRHTPDLSRIIRSFIVTNGFQRKAIDRHDTTVGRRGPPRVFRVDAGHGHVDGLGPGDIRKGGRRIVELINSRFDADAVHVPRDYKRFWHKGRRADCRLLLCIEWPVRK